MTFKEKLKQLVRPYKLSAIASAAGVHLNTVSSILKSDQAPKLDTIKRLSAAFGVDPIWMLDDSKSWPPVRVGRPALEEYQPPVRTEVAEAAA